MPVFLRVDLRMRRMWGAHSCLSFCDGDEDVRTAAEVCATDGYDRTSTAWRESCPALSGAAARAADRDPQHVAQGFHGPRQRETLATDCPGTAPVRDSKQPEGPVLVFGVSPWTSFLTYVTK
ncbi:DUF397 domain-containing protein [Streptomyces paradoxus]|uniref:DUF397 domain-containing protein n=1 Tax=Streptomyces paradoxus TaxID=66375 RepID=UPI00381AA371